MHSAWGCTSCWIERTIGSIIQQAQLWNTKLLDSVIIETDWETVLYLIENAKKTIWKETKKANIAADCTGLVSHVYNKKTSYLIILVEYEVVCPQYYYVKYYVCHGHGSCSFMSSKGQCCFMYNSSMKKTNSWNLSCLIRI